jgi:hypothetical protein
MWIRIRNTDSYMPVFRIWMQLTSTLNDFTTGTINLDDLDTDPHFDLGCSYLTELSPKS